MTQKLPPCCARRVSMLRVAEDDLRVLARRAAHAAQKGHDLTRYKEQIAEAKVQIKAQKQAKINHEADHAADEVSLWAS